MFILVNNIVMEHSIIDNIEKKVNEILKPDDDIFIPTYIPHKNHKKILVLSGGGIKGISFIGAIKTLEELNMLKHIDTFAGTSIGSIVIFLIILGYTSDELMQFVKSFDFGKLKDLSVAMLLESYGLDTGDKIIQMLKKFMATKNISPTITFNELHELTHKTLIITTVNVNNQCAEYFSHTNYPNINVLTAVRMSISIPFVFTPVMFNNCLYIDGGCIDNFPISQFSDNMDNVIGMCIIENKCKTVIKTMDEYILNVINSLINGITLTSIKYCDKNVIKIIIDGVNMIDFNLSLQRKMQLYEIGYKTTHDYFIGAMQ